jgi:hypothetical protein
LPLNFWKLGQIDNGDSSNKSMNKLQKYNLSYKFSNAYYSFRADLNQTLLAKIPGTPWFELEM